MSTQNVIQGLHHAEWELSNGIMCDKSGEPMSSPVNWVFSCLAKTGYYRRPKGFVSAEERAELDAALESEQMKKAHEARKKAAFETWLLQLSPSERGAIVMPSNSPVRMPEDTALRLHFSSRIWSEIQSTT